jgi:bleomycin hydrolase
MMSYLNHCSEINFWNESVILGNIRVILNHYLGEPPSVVIVDGKKMSPLDYLKKILKINPDDYIDILSLKEKPYFCKVEYPVVDNWWHSEEYYNIPLDEFMQTIKKAIRAGFTMAIGGDVSEAGYNSYKQVAMIPTFDIPSEYINEDARQFRFSNNSTSDDHGIHLIGYREINGKDWYLIKDSGSGSRNGPNKGYYFYHEDYVKLKMMDFTIHKDAVKQILSKFK